MREALNSNPLAQAGVVAVLLIVVAFFVVSSGGGGEEEGGEAAAPATTSVSPTTAAPSTEASPAGLSAGLATASQATTTAPLPRPVMRAWRSNQTLVLLFVRDGGIIDDRLVEAATAGLAGFRNAAVFIVPAREISRYASITEGVGVDRVPALIVVTPKHLNRTVPTASVSYGFQSPQSVAQAVIDAGYRGPTIDYHP